MFDLASHMTDQRRQPLPEPHQSVNPELNGLRHTSYHSFKFSHTTKGSIYRLLLQ